MAIAAVQNLKLVFIRGRNFIYKYTNILYCTELVRCYTQCQKCALILF